jgi:hypothetical protein
MIAPVCANRNEHSELRRLPCSCDLKVTRLQRTAELEAAPQEKSALSVVCFDAANSSSDEISSLHEKLWQCC